MFFLQNDIKKPKKKPGRDAGHRSPDWGCTQTPIFNENLWKIKKNLEIQGGETIRGKKD